MRLIKCCFLLLFSLCASATEKSLVNNNEPDNLQDFKETKYIHIEKISVPKEFKSIEDQIKQNIIDVILLSKKFTPVYSDKKALNRETHKNFYSINFELKPILKTDDYTAVFYMYNWISIKNRKRMYVRMSRFSLLNDIRFGVFELLFGKAYVVNNRDVIDIQNYERIQAVRKSNLEQKRIERNFKK